jgi:hypothetical protein
MFDIAGAASNAGLSEDEAHALLEVALGFPPDAAAPAPARDAVRLAAARNHVEPGLGTHLDAPGVDYETYTAENLTRLDAALDQYHSTYGKTSS